jgi:hypothetical protein
MERLDNKKKDGLKKLPWYDVYRSSPVKFYLLYASKPWIYSILVELVDPSAYFLRFQSIG